MKLLKILPITLIIFISGCAAQLGETVQTQPEETATPPAEETPPQLSQDTLQGEVLPQEEPPTVPPLPTAREFTIDADDTGFYIDNKDISLVSVSNGELVKITFNVRTVGTYFGGLDFRGCGQDTPNTKPGASIEIQFTADSTCTITSYWPSSGVVKDNLQIMVS